MPRIARSAVVPHPAAAMYELVRDVESYPAFLPWVREARVLDESETRQTATVSVTRGLPGTRFTTRNRLEPGRAIDASLVSGPFRRLEGRWRFEDLPDGGSRAELVVDFAFASRLFATLTGPALARACDAVVAAFVRRADALYGDGAADALPG